MQPAKNESTAAGQSKMKRASTKRSVKPDHPRYKEMIAAALKELKKPRGASRQAISKYITTKYSVGGSSSNHHLATALKSMVTDNALVITKGVGAAGSYKINREATVTKKAGVKKSTKAKKKPASKKVVKKRTNALAAPKKANAKKGLKAATKKAKAKSAAKGKRSAKVNKRVQKK